MRRPQGKQSTESGPTNTNDNQVKCILAVVMLAVLIWFVLQYVVPAIIWAMEALLCSLVILGFMAFG